MTYYITGDKIRFTDCTGVNGGQPTKEYISQPTPKTMGQSTSIVQTVSISEDKGTTRKVVNEEDVVEANKCYLAWLIKIGNLNDKNFIQNAEYDYKELKKLSLHYTVADLYQKSQNHSKEVEKYRKK